MKYKLYIKSPGINIKTLKEFDFPEKIVDFNFDEGMTILTKSNLIRLDLDPLSSEKIIGHKFSNCSSFSCNNGVIYLADNGGRDIYIITKRDKLCRLFVDGVNKAIINNLLRKHNDANCVVLGVNLGKAYVLIKELNRVFVQEHSSFKCLAGTGFAGYSVGPTAKTSMFNQPEGICIHLGKLFVSDTGNGIIRVIENDKVSTFVGHPVNDRIHAEKLIICRDMLCFNGNTGVQGISLDGDRTVFDIFKTTKKTMMCASMDKKNMYILEEI